FSANISMDDFRSLLVGRAIGRCYRQYGNVIKHQYYIADGENDKKIRRGMIQQIKDIQKSLRFRISSYIRESSLFLLSKKVVRDAINKGLALHLSNTKVVISKSLDGIPPLVLQKNNGSTTSITKQLA